MYGNHLAHAKVKKIATAGLPISDTYTKNPFSDKLKGLRQFRDHRWKSLGKENSDLSRLFLFRHYFESSEVSDPSEVPQIVGKLFF